MWNNLLLILIAAIILVGCGFKYGKWDRLKQSIIRDSSNAIFHDKNKSGNTLFSISDINKKLEDLAKTAPIIYDEDEIALCYAPIHHPYKYPYICPVCSSKTIYKTDFLLTVHEIDSCRKSLRNIIGLNVKLDESEFCKSCKPNVEEPRLILYVNIEGEPQTNEIINVTLEDIRLLSEFTKGDSVHFEDIYPKTLKKYTPRIKELLGIK